MSGFAKIVKWPHQLVECKSRSLVEFYDCNACLEWTPILPPNSQWAILRFSEPHLFLFRKRSIFEGIFIRTNQVSGARNRVFPFRENTFFSCVWLILFLFPWLKSHQKNQVTSSEKKILKNFLKKRRKGLPWKRGELACSSRWIETTFYPIFLMVAGETFWETIGVDVSSEHR